MLLSKDQKTNIVKWYWETKSIVAVQRRFRLHFKTLHTPCARTILRLQEKFIAHGTIKNQHKGNSGQKKTKRTPQDVAKIEKKISKKPSKSIRKIAQEVGSSRATVQRVLKADLRLKPYKMKIHQMISDADRRQRITFATWLKTKTSQDMDFLKRIWFSDEANFHLDGRVNAQNNRLWAAQPSPQAVTEQPLHSPKVTAWCAMGASGLVGPFFFLTPGGSTATVDQHGYVNVLKTFWQHLQKYPNLSKSQMNRMWFQQDGAPPHTSRLALEWLEDHFGPRVISRKTATPWPAHSPDLTPLDFYLWGYLKSQVYKESPKTLAELRRAIVAVARRIPADTCARVMEEVMIRAERCIRQNGGHVENVK